MVEKNTADLVVASFCLTVVMCCELALLWRVQNKAPSRFLKIFVILLLIGTLIGVVWTVLRYYVVQSDHNRLSGLEAILLFLSNTPISLAYLLYACRIQNLADSVWSLQHAGAQGCFRKIRPVKILMAILVITV